MGQLGLGAGAGEAAGALAADAETVRLEGELGRNDVGRVAALLQRRRPRRGGGLCLDLSAVSALDAAVVATLVHAWRDARSRDARVGVTALSDAARQALAAYRMGAQEPSAPRAPSALEALGGGILSAGDAGRTFLQLTADTTFAICGALLHPKALRWPALLEQAINIGSRALPIVGLISFLVGLTVAFQSAYQLRQFGAAVFVANLTAVGMVREMGPLMTAILVAGRSGSSIAAEIGTMQISEEVDALTVMGIDPVGYLAVPRLLAITLTVPLLTVLADLAGILGGFVVGVGYLDLAWNSYAQATIDALVAWDLLSGLVKSTAFAFGIGLIGLYYGFSVRGGAGEVGRTTTASVVASIFYIILADCGFSVVFYVVL